MSDHRTSSPATLLKAIKEHLIRLKASLAASAPWDKDIEFQRTDLRHKILHLLFTHPYSPEAQKLDSLLWLETSHAVIRSYRDRLGALDKSGASNAKGSRPIVQMRKLQNKFRSFLTLEESFWSGFALRLVRTFGLSEANAALVALNIMSPDPSDPLANVSQSSIASNGRALDDDTEQHEHSDVQEVQRFKKLMLVHKVLVCLGDLARYREQYNEGGGRPKAGQHHHSEDWKPRRGRGGKKATASEGPPPRDRDYSRAAECYQQARLLAPENGNPANQLSVLAAWQNDAFTSIYYAYRAICVRKPFPTAKDNLESTLRKVLDAHKRGVDKTLPSAEQFKLHVLALHAMWLVDPSSSSLSRQASKVCSLLKSMVERRNLAPELILQTFIMSLGAQWHIRMFTQPLPIKANGKVVVTPDTTTIVSSKRSEPLILAVILEMFRNLMEIASAEMDEGVAIAPNPHEEAQRITAVLRRMLPTLRVASKWFKGNSDYIKVKLSDLDDSVVDRFWSTYGTFAHKISITFPTNDTPVSGTVLEEGLDLKGFAPLKNGLLEASSMRGHDGEEPQVGEENEVAGVHPNIEQLMRIADLRLDAMELSQTELPSSTFRTNIRGSGSLPVRGSVIRVVIENSDDDESDNDTNSDRPAAGDDDRDSSVAPGLHDDDNATASSQTEDDPVTLAMRATLDSDYDDEEEQILYPIQKRPSQLEIGDRVVVTSQAGQPPPAIPVTSSTHPSTAGDPFDDWPNINIQPSRLSTTAEDLLAQAMGGSSPSSPRRAPNPSTPTRFITDTPHSTNSRTTPEKVRVTSQSSQAGLPMMFGSSASVWGTKDKAPRQPNGSTFNRKSMGAIGAGHGYGLSQSQISLNHQTWGRPHDMFGGQHKGHVALPPAEAVPSFEHRLSEEAPLSPSHTLSFDVVDRPPGVNFHPGPGSDMFDRRRSTGFEEQLAPSSQVEDPYSHRQLPSGPVFAGYERFAGLPNQTLPLGYPKIRQTSTYVGNAGSLWG